MEIKGIAKSIIERIIGRKLYKKLPFGISPLEDVINQFPVHQFSIVFDIGANIQSTESPT